MNYNIILVDGEPGEALRVTEHLQAEGYDVFTADGGVGALSLVASKQPWLLVVGEHLPDIKGDELLRKVAHHAMIHDLPHVIMLCVTPAGMHESISYEPGRVDMYLTKPFNPVEFRSFVRRSRESAERNEAEPGCHVNALRSARER